MTRQDARTVLANNGYNNDEASKILAKTDRTGSALTAPRRCPSLWVTRYRDGYRIQENDSGTDYVLAASL